jgi:hypothetical protein
MLDPQLVRKEDWQHREEMNLIEFPIGLLADRVPINPETGLEHNTISFERTVFEDGVAREQRWVVVGQHEYGGLPRGSDLDVFASLMTRWSKANFEGRLISLGSSYRVLLETLGRRPNGEEYARFKKSINRLYGVSFDTYHAIYDPVAKRRLPDFSFRFLSSKNLKDPDGVHDMRGFVRVTDDFAALMALGYLKFTDTDRLWRLPTTYARRLFQYLDKHRARALREQGGRFEINGYLLLKKLGTLDQTLRCYKPWKIRDVMGTHLDAIKADGYPFEYAWKKDGGPGAIMLSVTYAPYRPEEMAAEPAPLRAGDREAIETISGLLGDPESKTYFARVVRELGASRARAIAGEVLVQAERNPRTHKGKLFTHLAEQQRHRKGVLGRFQ